MFDPVAFETAFSGGFHHDLERMCRPMVLVGAVLATATWIPFLFLDLRLYPDNPCIVWLRLGLTAVGLIGILLWLFPRLREHSYFILIGMMGYLQLSAAAIVGLVRGEPAYIGGLCLIIMLVPVVPFHKKHSLLLIVANLTVFTVVGFCFGMSFRNNLHFYSLLNVVCAIVLSVVCVIILDWIRRENFRNQLKVQSSNIRLELSEMEIREVNEDLAKMDGRLREKIDELRKAFDEIKTLSGILPICSSCKKIRDDIGYWHQVEVYVRDHTGADFSHSICPECMKKLYPEFEMVSIPSTEGGRT